MLPDTITFHDIAGLVAGAHRGEGLGNRFLAQIRETDALLHVVRVHGDPGVVHPEGRVDPLADISVVETELLYADLEQAERRLERVAKTARGGDRDALAEERWLAELIDALARGRPAASVPPSPEAAAAAAALGLLTAKPVLYVANVDEGAEDVPPELERHIRQFGAPRDRDLGADRGRAGGARRRTRRGRCARSWESASRVSKRSSGGRSACSS